MAQSILEFPKHEYIFFLKQEPIDDSHLFDRTIESIFNAYQFDILISNEKICK